MDCSPPGSSIHGISQARILECIATSFSRGGFLTQGSNPSLLHWQSDSLPLSHLEGPNSIVGIFFKNNNYKDYIARILGYNPKF